MVLGRAQWLALRPDVCWWIWHHGLEASLLGFRELQLAAADLGVSSSVGNLDGGLAGIDVG